MVRHYDGARGKGLNVVRIRVLAVAALALVLAGCGTVHAGIPAASPSATATYRVAYGFSGDQIVSVSLKDSGRVLAIAAQVPAGRTGCASGLSAKLIQWNPSANITLTVESWAPGMNACPSQQMETTGLTLPAALGKRDVVIDTAGTFAPTTSTVLRRCSDLGGACTFPPVPPASCSNPSYSAAMGATAPPQDADFNAVGCDSNWLVLNVGWPGGPSGCDGPTCNQGSTVTHWFFRAGPHGWIVIANSRTAGCTRVHQVVPQFPTALCAGLPAVGVYATASRAGAPRLLGGSGADQVGRSHVHIAGWAMCRHFRGRSAAGLVGDLPVPWWRGALPRDRARGLVTSDGPAGAVGTLTRYSAPESGAAGRCPGTAQGGPQPVKPAAVSCAPARCGLRPARHRR